MTIRYYFRGCFLLFCGLHSVVCFSETRTVENLQVFYSRISECKETVVNNNAAFSIFDCGTVEGNKVTITAQSPAIFTVMASSKGTTKKSEFEALSNDLPLAPGPVLAWYSQNHQLRFLVFRISWGSEEKPFQLVERLVINFVSSRRICPLAVVDVKSNINANERVRELIADKFLETSECVSKPMWF